MSWQIRPTNCQGNNPTTQQPNSRTTHDTKSPLQTSRSVASNYVAHTITQSHGHKEITVGQAKRHWAKYANYDGSLHRRTLESHPEAVTQSLCGRATINVGKLRLETRWF